MNIKKQILNDVQEIKKGLETLSEANQKKIAKYEETKEQLSKIRIEISNVKTCIENNGSLSLEVHYKVPVAKIRIDDEGFLDVDEMFRAINLLNLISFEDMNKVQKKLEELKGY